MKIIKLWLTGVLAVIGIAASAQNYLPMKNSFSVGGGLLWGMSDSKGDFQDVAGTPTCYLLGMDYRHYPTPNVALGVTYDYITGNRGDNNLRCHYLAPTFTLRGLWANGKQGFWGTIGAGYLHYKDELYSPSYSYGDYKKGYFAASLSLGYEFAISAGVGMQLRCDMIMADWRFNEDYNPYHNSHDAYYKDDSMFDNGLGYISLGLTLVFGK